MPQPAHYVPCPTYGDRSLVCFANQLCIGGKETENCLTLKWLFSGQENSKIGFVEVSTFLGNDDPNFVQEYVRNIAGDLMEGQKVQENVWCMSRTIDDTSIGLRIGVPNVKQSSSLWFTIYDRSYTPLVRRYYQNNYSFFQDPHGCDMIANNN